MTEKHFQSTIGFDDPSIQRQFWINRIVQGGDGSSSQCLDRLLTLQPVNELVGYLSSRKENERSTATELLWYLWFHEAGPQAKKLIDEGVEFMEEMEHEKAMEVFNQIVQDYPKFAEGYNKRATCLYMLGHYENAIRDCKIVVKMNPVHFGAWHGMGLCLIQLEEYYDAIDSFQQALKIQPYATVNQEMIEYCRMRIAEKGGSE